MHDHTLHAQLNSSWLRHGASKTYAYTSPPPRKDLPRNLPEVMHYAAQLPPPHLVFWQVFRRPCLRSREPQGVGGGRRSGRSQPTLLFPAAARSSTLEARALVAPTNRCTLVVWFVSLSSQVSPAALAGIFNGSTIQPFEAPVAAHPDAIPTIALRQLFIRPTLYCTATTATTANALTLLRESTGQRARRPLFSSSTYHTIHRLLAGGAEVGGEVAPNPLV